MNETAAQNVFSTLLHENFLHVGECIGNVILQLINALIGGKIMVISSAHLAILQQATFHPHNK